MRLITKADFARERDVHASRVTQWIADGRVVVVDGKVDADESNRRLDATLDQSKGTRPGGNVTSSAPTSAGAGSDETPAAPGSEKKSTSRDETDYWTSKALREAAEAELAQLELAERRGELVNADEMKQAMHRRLRGVRDKLLNIADRIAPILAAERDASRVHAALTAEIKRVLHELSDGAAAEAGQQGAERTEERVAA